MDPITSTWLNGGGRTKAKEDTAVSGWENGNPCYALSTQLIKLFPAIPQDTCHVTEKTTRVDFRWEPM